MTSRTNTKYGFTLLEALVSIAILMIAIGAALSIVPQGLSSTRYARNQITASYLAQEAVEVVRNMRDDAMFYGGGDWLGHTNGGGVSIRQCMDSNRPCMVDSLESTLYECFSGFGCDPLKYRDVGEERIYGQGSQFLSFPDSIFTREVKFIPVENADASAPSTETVEVQVIVSVSWQEGLRRREVKVSENLYKWWSNN